LTDRLSQIDDLRVVPRGVAAAFADSALEATGRALSVRALVTGSVGQVGDRLVVRAELIDLQRLAQVWGAQFDRALTDLLEVQDALVSEIADQLRLEITTQEAEALTARSTENAEAYRLYLLSRHHNLRLTPEAWETGRRYAEEVVRLDPGYALGWAAVSDSYLTGVFLGLAPQVAYAQARVAAERAVALDSVLAQARVALGYAQHHGDWDWRGSLATLERAVALDSTNADAWQGVSEALTSLGRMDEAVAAAERAAALDPITPVLTSWLGAAYVHAGRLEEALRAHRRALELEPNLAGSRTAVPTLEYRLGRGEQALDELSQVLEAQGIDPSAVPSMALLMAHAGRADEAREIMARVDASQAPVASAAAWGWLGETDRAFELLDRATAVRDPGLWWTKVDWRFEPLRDDPRWPSLLERMGLPADEPRGVRPA
jgi:tetratricopeptide (TPR) repeat protein